MKDNNLTRRNFIKLAAVAGTSLTLIPKLAKSNTNVPPTILCISWDGADIRSLIPLLRAGKLPNLAELTVVRLECGGCSKTKPGHVEALTGLDYWITQVYSNDKFKEVPKEYSLFWRIKETYPNYWCGCIFSKGVNTGDSQGEPWRPFGDWARHGGIEYYANHLVPMSMEQTNTHLTRAISQFEYPGIIYCHYKQPDTSGHAEGMDSTPYRSKLRELDNALGWALHSLFPDFVIIYSDHGFDAPGKHTHDHAPHGFIAGNMSLAANGQRRDVARTIMGLLSLPVKTYEVHPDGKSLLIERQNFDSWNSY
jgi:hypothetical protein